MGTPVDAEVVLARDRALLGLLRLARDQPERLRLASGRLKQRVDDRVAKELQSKAELATRRARHIAWAYKQVTTGAGESVEDVGSNPWECEQLRALIQHFSEARDCWGSLPDDPIDAHVRYQTEAAGGGHERLLSRARAEVLDSLGVEDRLTEPELGRGWSSGARVPAADLGSELLLLKEYRERMEEFEKAHPGELAQTPAPGAYEAAKGEPAFDEERFAREVREECEPPSTLRSGADAAPWQLARVMSEFMEQEPDRIRTQDEWWEIVALVLCIECRDLAPSELGFDDDDLPWGGWEEVGGNIFAHRDGMRAYIDREPRSERKVERDEAFWLLARRAELYLRSDSAGGDVRLKAHHLDILEALRELRAVSQDNPAPPLALAGRAFGDEEKFERLKVPGAELTRWGYAGSKTGQGGGRWLTRLGLSEINARRPETGNSSD